MTVLICNPGRPQSHDSPASDSQGLKGQECAATPILIFLFQKSPDSLIPTPHYVPLQAHDVRVCTCTCVHVCAREYV